MKKNTISRSEKLAETKRVNDVNARRVNEAISAGAEVFIDTFLGKLKISRVSADIVAYTRGNSGFERAWQMDAGADWQQLLKDAHIVIEKERA